MDRVLWVLCCSRQTLLCSCCVETPDLTQHLFMYVHRHTHRHTYRHTYWQSTGTHLGSIVHSQAQEYARLSCVCHVCFNKRAACTINFQFGGRVANTPPGCRGRDLLQTKRYKQEARPAGRRINKQGNIQVGNQPYCETFK